ncbi:DMT family transporter [Lutimaribacter sp. EGI FJ00015]|uniref:DMT family transporter n=1 Tax=Lutimaribacter degradans TaxID=2945989 RepID=A0ACC5ZYU1_9RHOB|nr:DMT family transporter [Lutimaribacter sp. EGI FJ00013]MCM2563543.1 DMT family transporter [Lutimaribacter sp. EGI FJ00013]MCO0614794.1 DMT family transporter [Lutimaribacter sp. EGI FJ00015]MCO0637463.1 DMT family transporter [Lutimaribacter sp. EGI FJ00014]
MAAAALTDNFKGALLMMASMAAFTLNDTFVKALSGDLPLNQLLFLRGALTTVFVGLLAWRLGAFGRRIPRRDWLLVGLRLMAEIGSAYFFLTALFNMPLANVTAILQSLPLVVTLTAALLFSEPLGWRRLSAILIGLCGVLLIVRPGTEGFTLYSVYALVAVGFVTIRDLSTRRLSAETPSMLVTFLTSAAVMMFFGLGSLAEPWVTVTPQAGLFILCASVMIIGGYLSSIMVMRVGEISFVTPFRYTGLLWALMLGWVVFGDWPQTLTLVGAAIVAGSGIFTLYRERQLARAGRIRARV